MEFKHKDIVITVQEDGLFHFDVGDYHGKTSTLEGAKNKIDSTLKDYYTITLEDYKKVLAKLNSREKKWVEDLVQALSCHYCNAYCEIGDNTTFDNRTLYAQYE